MTPIQFVSQEAENKLAVAGPQLIVVLLTGCAGSWVQHQAGAAGGHTAPGSAAPHLCSYFY